ncbi:MAG: hypothetical protein IPP74_13735 [Alphaproteobacteria bacterium]|nr:hypothetical protein [Alphaproteobacteria bacterium]
MSSKDSSGKPGAQIVCLVTGDELLLTDALRLVVSPTHQLVVDIGQNLPGQCGYVACRRWVIESFVQTLAARDGWNEVVCGEDFADKVAAILKHKALSMLGMANRSGVVLTGFEKIVIRLEKGHQGILVQACDASVEGKRKLQYTARGCSLILDQIFSREELSSVLGKENAVHLWLKESSVTRAFVEACQRLIMYNGPKS